MDCNRIPCVVSPESPRPITVAACTLRVPEPSTCRRIASLVAARSRSSYCCARARTAPALADALQIVSAASCAAMVAARARPARPATMVPLTTRPGGPAAPKLALGFADEDPSVLPLREKLQRARLPTVAARMAALRRRTHEVVASAVPWSSSSEEESASPSSSLSRPDPGRGRWAGGRRRWLVLDELADAAGSTALS